nr:hypothetical protein [Deltaproteobacteria bacterium]
MLTSGSGDVFVTRFGASWLLLVHLLVTLPLASIVDRSEGSVAAIGVVALAVAPFAFFSRRGVAVVSGGYERRTLFGRERYSLDAIRSVRRYRVRGLRDRGPTGSAAAELVFTDGRSLRVSHHPYSEVSRLADPAVARLAARAEAAMASGETVLLPHGRSSLRPGLAMLLAGLAGCVLAIAVPIALQAGSAPFPVFLAGLGLTFAGARTLLDRFKERGTKSLALSRHGFRLVDEREPVGTPDPPTSARHPGSAMTGSPGRPSPRSTPTPTRCGSASRARRGGSRSLASTGRLRSPSGSSSTATPAGRATRRPTT